jgi:hypothetical protein
MKILIANAVHSSKDYAMEQWLENVAQLQQIYPAHLTTYCKKHKIKNYTVIHLELPQSQGKFERIARSRELIRHAFLDADYDAWFSWESDILIPTSGLRTLIELLNSENYLLVAHNNWTRQRPEMPNYDWGLALITRRALEKYDFLFELGKDGAPETYEPSEEWFRKRILRDGGKFIETTGLIAPIYHLDFE